MRPACHPRRAVDNGEGLVDLNACKAPGHRAPASPGLTDQGSTCTQTEGQQLRAVLIADKVPVFKAEVPMLVAFKKASAEGKTVADIRNRNAWRAGKAYRSVRKEIVEG